MMSVYIAPQIEFDRLIRVQKNKDLADDEQIEAAKGDQDIEKRVMDELEELENVDGQVPRDAEIQHGNKDGDDIGRGGD